MDNKWKRTTIFWIYGFVVILLAIYVYFLGPRNVDSMIVFGDIAQLVTSLFAGVAMVYPLNKSIFGVEQARPWRYIGAGFIAWGIGQAVWSFFEIVQRIEVPSVSWADIGFLLLYPLVFIGFYYQLKLYKKLKPPTFLLTLLLLFFVGGYLYLEWGAINSVVGFELFVRMLYIIGDIGIVVGAALIANSTRGGLVWWAWMPLFWSFFLFSVGNSTFDYLEHAGTYQTGSLVDLSWIVAFVVAWIGAHIYSTLMRVD